MPFVSDFDSQVGHLAIRIQDGSDVVLRLRYDNRKYTPKWLEESALWPIPKMLSELVTWWDLERPKRVSAPTEDDPDAYTEDADEKEMWPLDEESLRELPLWLTNTVLRAINDDQSPKLVRPKAP